MHAKVLNFWNWIWISCVFSLYFSIPVVPPGGTGNSWADRVKGIQALPVPASTPPQTAVKPMVIKPTPEEGRYYRAYHAHPHNVFKSTSICSMVLASRASGRHLNAQTLKTHPSGYPKLFMRNFLKCQFQAYNWTFSTLYKNIMSYFNKLKHVCGCNLSIVCSSLSKRMPKYFTIANFRHWVSKSWLRPWNVDFHECVDIYLFDSVSCTVFFLPFPEDAEGWETVQRSNKNKPKASPTQRNFPSKFQTVGNGHQQNGGRQITPKKGHLQLKPQQQSNQKQPQRQQQQHSKKYTVRQNSAPPGSTNLENQKSKQSNIHRTSSQPISLNHEDGSSPVSPALTRANSTTSENSEKENRPLRQEENLILLKDAPLRDVSPPKIERVIEEEMKINREELKLDLGLDDDEEEETEHDVSREIADLSDDEKDAEEEEDEVLATQLEDVS